ncbi:lipopolysaccharide assembly protein LapA domain-containing protein [uncultured Arthrobacter sp.]|uniref:LapA family protein n=1 Tax=uncultured Arthrobacter sp. TaxID=114050 RepID=UPI003216452B
MTQTPRGFDPHDPQHAVSAQRPGAADAPAAEEAYTTAPASGSTDLVSGAPADSMAAQRVETPRAEAPDAPALAPEPRQVTRAGMVWAAVASALVVLILLIAFILQNQEYVQVKFFGLQGSVPLGIALFIAAVGGGVLVAIAGAARIIQLRLAAHRARGSRQAGRGTRAR